MSKKSEIDIDEPVKLCVGCQEVKPLSTGYYKAGVSWQKRCKKCYLVKTKKYIKKPQGFYKLDKEIQEKIKYDIYVRVNYKEIAKKYNIKYPTLLNWKLKGIPAYKK